MRNRILLCWLLAGVPLLGGAATYVSVNFNVSTYPELVPVPGYPVYYAPRLHANFFFYDGLYWLLIGDSWYVSSWYNGPWSYVGPDAVPLFILRVPVRYYLAPPVYFVDWRRDAPPMWGRHWGPDWERRHEGWEHWNPRAVPARAPLPTYQRPYAGSRYPQPAQQQALQNQHYRYRPHDAVAQQHFQAPASDARPAPFIAQERQHAPPGRQEHAQPERREHAQQQQQQQRPPQQEHPQQRQQAVPHYGPPAQVQPPLPSPPPHRIDTNRPPPPREQAPYQQAMPPGHAAPPREAAPRPERGEERRGPPGRQNEGRRDKDQHDER